MPKYYSKSGAKSTFNKKSQDGKEISMQISPYTWMMRDIDKLIKESEDIAPQETRKMEEFIKRFLPETWKVFGGEQYIEEWNDFPGEVESYYI
jgi:hypothetical protein